MCQQMSQNPRPYSDALIRTGVLYGHFRVSERMFDYCFIGGKTDQFGCYHTDFVMELSSLYHGNETAFKHPAEQHTFLL
uniref:Uncharacterized protein n=1 Tax=Romanomermis culicivorax TaxID=13658 RepID=A0A915HR36_ROMCU